ncbi:MAG: TorF family putative porin [Quisquiliibacterium sp.]
MRKLAALTGVVAALSALPSAGFAQTTPAHSFTGNFSLVSEYRYRGIAQTDKKPALQGGFDYGHADGAYLGLWGSNVSWIADAGGGSNSLEVDLYGGYKMSVGDIGLDFGALHYNYPGTITFDPKPNTTELYVGASWKMLTLKYSQAVTDIFGFPDSKGSTYVDLGASFDVGSGVTLGAHYGHQTIKNNAGCSYDDWKLGLSKDFAGLNLGLAYVGTNAGGCYGNLGKDTVVLSVTKTF